LVFERPFLNVLVQVSHVRDEPELAGRLTGLEFRL
jgi:hypothetical protein